MQKILMLNLSPKGKSATSLLMLGHIKERFNKRKDANDLEISIKSLREFSSNKKKLLNLIYEADDVVFATPLYVDTLPAYVIEFLDYLADNFKTAKNINLYGVVNCGFIEAYYNIPGLNIFENFANEVGFTWRFGLGLGAGGFLGESNEGIPFEARVKAEYNFALNSFVESFFNKASMNNENITATAKMPKRLYAFVGTQNFKKLGKENNIKIKATPHYKKA
ncbi:MAG: hypothetical protein ACRCWG_04100 [Sarcina sp.]